MNLLTWTLSALAALAVLALSTAIGDLFSEELRARLDQVPFGLLRLAARRLPAELREEHMQGWVGELHEILRGAEAMPVTRLWRGIGFAVGLLWSAPSIAGALTDQPKPDAARARRHGARVSPGRPRRFRITPAAAGTVGATTSGFWGVVTEFVPFTPARIAVAASIGGLAVWAAFRR